MKKEKWIKIKERGKWKDKRHLYKELAPLDFPWAKERSCQVDVFILIAWSQSNTWIYRLAPEAIEN